MRDRPRPKGLAGWNGYIPVAQNVRQIIVARYEPVVIPSKCGSAGGARDLARWYIVASRRAAHSTRSRDELTMYYRRSSLAPPAHTTKLGMTSPPDLRSQAQCRPTWIWSKKAIARSGASNTRANDASVRQAVCGESPRFTVSHALINGLPRLCREVTCGSVLNAVRQSPDCAA